MDGNTGALQSFLSLSCLSVWRFAPPKTIKARKGRLPIGRRMPSGPT
jgi:hypothetical protein